ncbi:unnamed protein product [Adineta ricciae]|uniref:Uncharacterized protein n=1 Tax=Adineta ricciae TaxID=249248 RepID=A0A813YGZ3_ADIRI|nr:unnamed protein product [Adineta ricciae]
MSLRLTSRIKLNDGHLMPIFGLGLYQAAASSKTTQIIADALRLGYPLIDTAELYQNESQHKAFSNKRWPPRSSSIVSKLITATSD